MKTLGKKILWQRARDYIRRHHPMLIGVAGSSGKTMAKDAIALAIGPERHVRAAPYSYNTRVGVALSVLGVMPKTVAKNWFKLLVGSRIKEIGPDPDTIVLELGADRPGDIDFFARLLPFHLGVITNIQSAHLHYFVDKERVAHEHTSLIVDLPQDGTAILNTDDPLVLAMADKSRAPVIFYGTAPSADIRLLRHHRLPQGNLACEINASGQLLELHLPHVIADYQLHHLLAALAVAQALKIDTKKAAQRLQQLKPPPGRLRQLPGLNDTTILDDSYNASPEATLAALKLLRTYPAKRRIAILGDMLDLGAASVTQHQQVGSEAATTTDIFIAVGDRMRDAATAALAVGTPDVSAQSDSSSVGGGGQSVSSARSTTTPKPLDVHHVTTPIDAATWTADILKPGDVILIKGSRDMHMEEIVKRLRKPPPASPSEAAK